MVTCEEVEGQGALRDGGLPAQPVRHAPAVHVARQLVEELEGRHGARDRHLVKPEPERDTMCSRGALAGLGLGPRQLAPQQQFLDVEEVLGEVAEVEGDELRLELEPAAPERGEGEAGEVGPGGLGVALHELLQDVVPPLHARVRQDGHLHAAQVALEQPGPGLNFIHLFSSLDINISILLA